MFENKIDSAFEPDLGIDDISFRVDFFDLLHIQHVLVPQTFKQPIQMVFCIGIKLPWGYPQERKVQRLVCE